ncbi:MAG: DUF2281 domain-containing protein [Leptolyngbyaceae cyanobacterium SM2_5_2]|nr:DUF2281 domain-containing protein [Leptolyngbyaceae cyanobacterium SM2_5_2]
MELREAAIAKIQHLPESLLQEISDFIDFVAAKHSVAAELKASPDLAERWSAWLQDVDALDAIPSKPTGDYPQHLIEKYRQQGLEF